MLLKQFDIESLTLESEDKPECKGLFWRGRVTSWFDGSSMQTRKSLHLLKRKSCRGCENCDWIYDWMYEDFASYGQEDLIGKIEDGKMYIIQFNGGIDYESGHYEIDDWELVEVKEEK